MAIDKQKIRARIKVGNIDVSTPDVVSFSVSRARKQPAATFSATFKVDHNTVGTGLTNADIKIWAGVNSPSDLVFTGIVEKATTNPIRTDASKVMLSLSGRDIMSLLEGQTIDRRMKTWPSGDGPPEKWAVVTGVTKQNTPIKQKFKPKITSFTPKAVLDLPVVPSETTPDAFRVDADVDRTAAPKVFGGLEVIKLIE